MASARAPRFRDWLVLSRKTNWAECFEGAHRDLSLLVEVADHQPGKWAERVDTCSNLPGPIQAHFLDALEGHAEEIASADPAGIAWGHLRAWVRLAESREREEGSDVPRRLRALYERMTPAEPLASISRLFASRVELLDVPLQDWRKNEAEARRLQERAVKGLVASGDAVGALVRLAELVPKPSVPGAVLGRVPEAEPLVEALLAAEPGAALHKAVTTYLAAAYVRRGSPDWLCSRLQRLITSGQADVAMAPPSSPARRSSSSPRP